MNIDDRRRQLGEITPEVPENFHKAMCDTLEGIVAREQNAQADRERADAVRGLRRKGRILIFVLVAALLLAGVALAAYHWKLFDALSFMTGPSPMKADEVMQSDLAQVTVNNVTITINEAGYDGKTLFLRYTYHMLDVDTPLGAFRDGAAAEYGGEEGISEEDMQLLYDHNVGWWIDQLWIDGRCVDMPNNSGGVTSGSTTPGEIVQTEYWRLDNVDVQLSGEVEIALPIGECQSVSDYSLLKHPEKYDENGMLMLPEKGMVTFTLNTEGMLNKVVTENPDVPVTTSGGTAEVSEVSFTPLMTYITLKLEADPDAVAAYQAEYGEGFYDDDGNLLWAYGGADVFTDWIDSLNLVDGDGNLLFPDNYGQNGLGDDWAEFVYPYIENIPEALYLAPVTDGTADLTEAVRVR